MKSSQTTTPRQLSRCDWLKKFKRAILIRFHTPTLISAKHIVPVCGSLKDASSISTTTNTFFVFNERNVLDHEHFLVSLMFHSFHVVLLFQGVDEKYDNDLVEYFTPYHQFVDKLVRYGLTLDKVNESVIKLSKYHLNKP